MQRRQHCRTTEENEEENQDGVYDVRDCNTSLDTCLFGPVVGAHGQKHATFHHHRRVIYPIDTRVLSLSPERAGRLKLPPQAHVNKRQQQPVSFLSSSTTSRTLAARRNVKAMEILDDFDDDDDDDDDDDEVTMEEDDFDKDHHHDRDFFCRSSSCPSSSSTTMSPPPSYTSVDADAWMALNMSVSGSASTEEPTPREKMKWRHHHHHHDSHHPHHHHHPSLDYRRNSRSESSMGSSAAKTRTVAAVVDDDEKKEEHTAPSLSSSSSSSQRSRIQSYFSRDHLRRHELQQHRQQHDKNVDVISRTIVATSPRPIQNEATATLASSSSSPASHLSRSQSYLSRMNLDQQQTCDECENESACTYCHDCDLVYCHACNDQRHRKGKLRFHARQSIMSFYYHPQHEKSEDSAAYVQTSTVIYDLSIDRRCIYIYIYRPIYCPY
jgi:hypothetical protein